MKNYGICLPPPFYKGSVMKVLNLKDINFLKSKIIQIHYLYGLV